MPALTALFCRVHLVSTSVFGFRSARCRRPRFRRPLLAGGARCVRGRVANCRSTRAKRGLALFGTATGGIAGKTSCVWVGCANPLLTAHGGGAKAVEAGEACFSAELRSRSFTFPRSNEKNYYTATQSQKKAKRLLQPLRQTQVYQDALFRDEMVLQ